MRGSWRAPDSRTTCRKAGLAPYIWVFRLWRSGRLTL
jgi:hypothetical protein